MPNVQVSNLLLPTPKMFRMLLNLYFNGECNYKTQDIFKDRCYFYETMKKLLMWNVINVRRIIVNDKFINCFSINGNGKILIEEFIYDYHKCITKSE